MANTLSTSITGLDAQPPLFPTGGSNGGAARLRSIMDTVTVASAIATGDTYKVVRLPTHAIVKQVLVTNGASAATTLTADIDVFYSDNGPYDTSNPVNNGNVVQVSAADNKLFGAAVAFTAGFKQQDQTYGNTANFPIASGAMQPLWQVLGLASDPGGFFDVGLKAVTVTGAVTSGPVTIEVRFTESF